MSGSESLASRFLRGQGLAELPLADCGRLLPSCPRRQFVFEGSTDDSTDALSFLSTLTLPATRHVVFSGNEQVTAFINNSRNGSDYADYTYQLPRHLACRFVRVVSSTSRIWSNGTDRERLEYEARIFELFDQQGERIRAVYCADDGGRWSFGASGTPHPIESSFPYNAKRKRDRFSPGNLHRLIESFGFPLVTAPSFLVAAPFLLYRSPSGVAEKTACSIEEADDPAYGYYRRGLTWVAHMQTHFRSVIHDFERCIRLNPSYKEKVDRHLQEAYRHA